MVVLDRYKEINVMVKFNT